MTCRLDSSNSAEIRNKIYCLTLVTDPVTIQDLHPEEWQAQKEAGHATRTSYKTKDHSGLRCFYHNKWAFNNSKLYSFKTEKWKNAKVESVLPDATDH